MSVDNILGKVLDYEPITRAEAYELYDNAPLQLLCGVADTLRRQVVADPTVVTWQEECLVSITNVCKAGCLFCNSHRKPHEEERAYITTMAQYRHKIDEALKHGIGELSLRGGLHPRLGIDFYETLLRQIKSEYPQLKLMALSAPEISHIASVSNLHTIDVLERLRRAGLDMLSGMGADILSDDVRKRISSAKPSAREWVRVMHEAHKMGIATTATMMYGHIERPHQRVDHLITIRDLQALKPEGSQGFIAFTAWPFCASGTQLESEGIAPRLSSTEYLRIVAMSRIVLNNIANIETSWQTVGSDVAEIALKSGANDMGSVMVCGDSSTGEMHLDSDTIKATIRRAGFTPQLRDQRYRYGDAR